MTLYTFYTLVIFESHLVFKIFLWACLILLFAYIILIEFKILKKEKEIQYPLNEDTSNIETTEVTPRKSVSFYEKKAKTLIILLIAMSIITLILTFTY